MRYKIVFESSRGVNLPIHYNHIIRGVVYSILGKEAQDFTFSNLFGRKKVLKNKKRIIFKGRCHFYLSGFSLPDLSEFKGKSFRLGANEVKLVEVEPQSFDLKEGKLKLKTLSPITVFQLLESGKTRYFTPEELPFYEKVVEDLKGKVERLYGFSPEVSFSAHPDSVFKKAVVQYRNRFVIEAWKGIFTLEGDKEALETALNLGLGFRNDQGFGMVATAGSSVS